jgi:hypothetical protein
MSVPFFISLRLGICKKKPSQCMCIFHKIQRHHKDLKKEQENILTDYQIQRFHSDIKNLIGRNNRKQLLCYSK